jgi:hypothetical protein
MAKKKTKRRHHRVGAMSLNPKSTLVRLASVAAGYFLGDTINSFVDSVTPASIFPVPVATVPPTAPATGFSALGFNQDTVVGAIEGGLGAMLLMSKGKASLLKTGAGGILAGAGLHRLLKKTGYVTGYQAVPVIGRHRVAGYQAVPVIGKIPAQLRGAGGPSQLEGFRVNGYNPTGSGSNIMGKISGLYDGRGVAGQGSGSGSGITTSESGSECME